MTKRQWSSRDNKPRPECDPFDVIRARLEEGHDDCGHDKAGLAARAQDIEDAFSLAMDAEIAAVRRAAAFHPDNYNWVDEFEVAQASTRESRVLLAGTLLMLHEANEGAPASEKEDLIWRAFMLLRAPCMDRHGMQRLRENQEARKKQKEARGQSPA